MGKRLDIHSVKTIINLFDISKFVTDSAKTVTEEGKPCMDKREMCEQANSMLAGFGAWK